LLKLIEQYKLLTSYYDTPSYTKSALRDVGEIFGESPDKEKTADKNLIN